MKRSYFSTKIFYFLVLLLPSITFCKQAEPDSDVSSGSSHIKALFTMTKDCPAFISKNKQYKNESLPEEQRSLKKGDVFPVSSTLSPNGKPTWYYLRTDLSEVKMRWVRAECGTYKSSGTTVTSRETRTNFAQCSDPFQGDHLVASFSWISTFCGGKSQKSECKLRRAESYTPTYSDSHFGLHGVWPGKVGCRRYSYCGRVKRNSRSSSMCSYPKIDTNFEVDLKLEMAEGMPSYASGSCLQRHEWWKHGTCLSKTPAEYFDKSIDLLEQLNQSTFVEKFITANLRKKVKLSDIHQAFDESFVSGEGNPAASTKLSVHCVKGNLQEIRIKLAMPSDEPVNLENLMKGASEYEGKDNCPTEVYIPVIK